MLRLQTHLLRVYTQELVLGYKYVVGGIGAYVGA